MWYLVAVDVVVVSRSVGSSYCSYREGNGIQEVGADVVVGSNTSCTKIS